MITLVGPFLLLALYVTLVASLAPRFQGLSLWARATGIGALGLWAMPFLLLFPRPRRSHRDWNWMALVTAAVLLGAAPAAANDLCFLDSLGFPPLIAEDFSLPKPGECTQFRRLFQDGAFLASGVACGSWEIGNINVATVIESPVAGEAVSYSFFVNRATMTGEGALFCAPVECGAVFGIPFGSLTFSIRQTVCPSKEVPAP